MKAQKEKECETGVTTGREKNERAKGGKATESKECVAVKKVEEEKQEGRTIKEDSSESIVESEEERSIGMNSINS